MRKIYNFDEMRAKYALKSAWEVWSEKELGLKKLTGRLHNKQTKAEILDIINKEKRS